MGALVLIAAVAMVAGRINMVTPPILVVAGIGVIPGVPRIELDPEIILLRVLPPCRAEALSGARSGTDWQDRDC